MPPEPEAPPPKPGSEALPPGYNAAPVAVVIEAHPPRRRPRTDLTTGSIPKKLFAQAWPQSIEGILNILDQSVDLFWASKLPGGFRSIASIGIAQTFVQVGMQARAGLDESMSAMVARAVGARNIGLANHVVFQGLVLTLAYSFVMTIVGLFLTDFFLRIIGTTEAVHAETALYMQVQFIGMATQNLRTYTGRALQASGEVIIPLRATFVSRVIHISLSPFLIFGWGFFPHLGLAGASLAAVIAQSAGVAINGYALFKGQGLLHVTWSGNRLDLPVLGRMIKIGLPASIRGAERSMSRLALLGVATGFGDVALAAFSLTRQVENITGFAGGGIAQAAGVMVGQNLGANQPGRAKQAIWWAQAYVSIMNLFARGLFIVFPLAIIMIFTKNVDVIDLTVQWVRLQLIGSFFLGTMTVFQSAFMGAGDTMAVMIVTLIGVWGIEVPAAIFLSHTSLGPLALGVGNILSMSSRSLFFFCYYFTGRWLRIKVL